jgi:hypothetical protein
MYYWFDSTKFFLLNKFDNVLGQFGEFQIYDHTNGASILTVTQPLRQMTILELSQGGMIFGTLWDTQ